MLQGPIKPKGMVKSGGRRSWPDGFIFPSHLGCKLYLAHQSVLLKARRVCCFLVQERGHMAVGCWWFGAGALFLEGTAEASSLSSK